MFGVEDVDIHISGSHMEIQSCGTRKQKVFLCCSLVVFAWCQSSGTGGICAVVAGQFSRATVAGVVVVGLAQE